jgi:hypothetical protein
MLKRMKHAGAGALDRLKTLLERLRNLPIREKSRGIFYLRSRPFLHFHEDATGIFADLRGNDAWQRFRVTTRAEQAAMLAQAKRLTASKTAQN